MIGGGSDTPCKRPKPTGIGLICRTVGVGVGEEAVVMVVEGDIVLKLFVLGGVIYASGDVIMEGDSARILLG